MNARLAQLLRYLERDGVTEVLVRTGQPVSMRTANGPTDVTARPLSSEQLEAIVRDTELAALMTSKVQDAEVELQAGTLRVVARLTRPDGGIAITLTRAALPPPPRPEPVAEFDVDLELEIDPLPVNAIAPIIEPPVRRSVAGPPPLDVGIGLDLSLDDTPDSDRTVPPARVLNPVIQRADNPATRQDPRPSAGAFQRVDLRDARAPTPRPEPAASTDDSSAWADIDLAPPSRKR